ncbi:MAG: 1-deoxy-D-xylulose-5-phosphate synthase [Dehalococcoidia bacterium]|nr:1-deoxy-D-xylulose-5-phosphate synthase [Dehalococcoidia bacterium]
MLKILDRINSPADLRALTPDELVALATEIREEMVRVISLNGGHLASSLGAVELTIALHRVFESPRDKIIWDVGHQSYAHKLITERRERFHTIRQYGGLSGFPVRAESPHDVFTTGHAGTSISAALGMGIARDINKENYHVVAVIGDGSLGTGMAFEAINHAGHLGTKLIVVLNDNGMAISPSIGALSRLLNQVRLDARYARVKKRVKGAFAYLPFGESAWILSKRMKRSVERVILPNAFWEELGFTYLGPLDGHNIKEIEAALIRARDSDAKPTLIHVLTQKGKGYPEAETDVVKYHGISPNGSTKSQAPSYSQIFGQTVSRLMKEDQKIVAISAAMIDGTGLAKVASEFPDRVFDVGICEQHAVTLAAGLATQGFIPIVAIYSTFLQRAYDQIIHDVCLQNLPVVFAIDRAGIVGEDGKTHQGPFDISYLRCIPNMVIASPADEDELQHLLYSAVYCKQPIAIRYPRGNGKGVNLKQELQKLPIGKGVTVREGEDLTVLAIGPAVHSAIDAVEILAKEGVDCTVVNARFAKPLDSELILSQVERTRKLLTVEENTLCGGFGSAVMELIRSAGFSNLKIESLGLPDKFIEHGPQELFRSLFNLDSEGIAQYIRTSFPELFSKVSFRKQEGK